MFTIAMTILVLNIAVPTPERRLFLFVAVVILASSCVSKLSRGTMEPSQASSVDRTAAIIHSFENGLAATNPGNPAVKLHVTADESLGNEAVLLVDYPAASSDPAARDVHFEAATTNWSTGRALSFLARPSSAIRISVSFVDRNGVAYTSWRNLQAGVWQTVEIEFAMIRPNPYFQPPSAKAGAPLEVSEVKGLALAPQDSAAGRLAIGRIILVR